MTRAFRTLARQPEPGTEIGGHQQIVHQGRGVGRMERRQRRDRASRPRTAPHAAAAAPANRRRRTRPADNARRGRSRCARSSVWPCDAVGAPVDVVEQAPVRLLDAEQVVAAIGRRTEHGAVARPRQHLRGLDQQRGRQGRAVGIEHHGGRVAGGEQPADRLEQTIAEIGQPGFDQADLARQIVDKELLRARRAIGHVAVDRRRGGRRPGGLRIRP